MKRVNRVGSVIAARRGRCYQGTMPRRRPVSFLDSYAVLKRTLSAIAHDAYASLGLGQTQAKLLRAIGQHQPMSQADLGRATMPDPALTGRALRSLLDRGLVQRRRSRADRRAFSLELTERGEALFTEVQAKRKALAAALERRLDASDLAAFERLVGKLSDAFPG